MGLTSAMYTGLSGLHVNQERIDTIGNNVANVNTTAFKGSRTLFQTQLSQIISNGSPPSDVLGGTNPMQYGRGAVVGATQRNFTAGSIESTGIPSDLAIEGNGFFVLRKGNNEQVYTRDGAFSLDANNRLVSMDGYAVRGFGVDQNFTLVPGTLTDLSIPLGTMSMARATTRVQMDGDLSSAGTIATQGTTLNSQALVDGGGSPATAGTLLSDLRAAAAPGTNLLADGNTITVSGLTRGDRALPPQKFVVGTDGTTLGDFAAWLQNTAQISTASGVPGTPGVTIENGALVVRGNAGEANAIGIAAGAIVTNNASISAPFSFSQTQAATGAGVFTSYTVYDSLGEAVPVYVSFALEGTPGTGPVWRYYVDAPDSAGNIRSIGTGTVAFDTQGNFVSADGNQLSLDRGNSGAVSPLQFTMDFSGVYGLSTQTSNLIMSLQDGFPPGTLNSFGVGPDGTVTGTFSNGLVRTLGQVAVATFANDQGLVGDSDNVFSEGPNSGGPSIAAPGQFDAGAIRSGALELSNVDLSREFIGLITSSSAFQAASRVISTSSDMLDQLLLVTR